MTAHHKNETHPSLAGTGMGLSPQEEGASPVSHDTNATNIDAQEFGRHLKQGGWRLGLLVARNVEKGADNGRPRNLDDRRGFQKVSTAAFAKASSTSDHRVARYLEAWTRAAEAGLVPAASELSPGVEIDLDVETLPDWSKFYDGAATTHRRMDDDRRKALIEQAEEDGVGRGKVQEIALNPKALVTAIKADPATAQAAANALAYTSEDVRRDATQRLISGMSASDRNATRRALDTAAGQTDVSIKGRQAEEREEAARKERPDLRATAADAMLGVAKVKIAAAIREIHDANLNEDARAILRERVVQIAKTLDLLTAEIDGVASVDWDAELASLTGGE